MVKQIKGFLFFYIPGMLAISFLTLDRISFLTLPTPPMLGLNLLPLTGTYILLPGVILGAAIIMLMGDKEFAKNFLMAGLVFDILFSVAVCNLFRTRLLAAVAVRYGKASAIETAEGHRGYTLPFFSVAESLPGLQGFAKSDRDKETLRKNYVYAYNNAFTEMFPDLIDRKEIFEQGHRAGYTDGLIAGRYANIRDESFMEEPLQEQDIIRVESEYLPDFAKGYAQGYRGGWHAGYNENLKDN